MIPNKSNFRFEELSVITGVKPYVIRFWETEFPEIAPVSSDGGSKLYARKDVEAILKVKKLLFEDKMTIHEAKVRISVPDKVEEIVVETFKEEVQVNSTEIRPLILSALETIRRIKARRNW